MRNRSSALQDLTYLEDLVDLADLLADLLDGLIPLLNEHLVVLQLLVDAPELLPLLRMEKRLRLRPVAIPPRV
jgi:hypothetical protein